uniref:Ig-like domain-containing protein n=1 Tax=Electrophorus electricus TaxID=8005 RepID=A0AAY5ECA3_ELEEL
MFCYCHSPSGVGCVELTQPASVVVKPRESFSISCKISESSYCINWIRQPTGKALEWLGYLCSGGGTNLKDTVKNKISFSQDTSSSTVFLRGQNFEIEDTAVYYCARESQHYTYTAGLYKNNP